mmetsp:Transcript_27337/g.44412  ORF Transcript_27337/g.44412 Transcript_27337/m.44412 type:complete len:513 (-) Transcript_27337:312-1850(-)|eukprot:scaffold33000_cov154-Skeletonema_menzelii.AAC.4
MKDNQEEDYSSPYAMTAAYYPEAQSGHNHMMRGGGNDESQNESSYEFGSEHAAADSRSMPPQALAYDNQYMGAYPPVGWYAAPLPPTSSQYNYHHPTAHHSMMYPAYHVPSAYSSATTQYQHLQYPTIEESPSRYGRVKADFSNANEGDFVRTGDRQRDLRSALYYVRKNPSATLFDIDGFIAEIAKADEGGSRFVQRRLQNGKETEKRLALQAALRSFSDLWPDPFGNFMLQGLLEVGSAEMREELMTAVFAAGVVDMTLNMHGCRVIQKALLVLDQVSVCKIITELQDIEEVIPFIFDPNGNHVIQKAIQIVSTFAKSAAEHGDIDEAINLMNQIKFIIDDVAANVEKLSKHRYGCRVIQRTIEHCPEEQRDEVLTKICACHRSLIEDQFGNYVIQQALSIGSEDIMAVVVETLSEGDLIFKFSKHKYASNVVEVMFQSATPDQKEAVLNAMLQDFEGTCGIVQLAKDPIGNYVVKNAIDCAEGQQKEKIFAAITSNRQELVSDYVCRFR